MSMQEGLKLLAAREAQAPWSFEEFEQRRARAAQQRRTVVWSAALSVAALTLVSGLALLTQPDDAVRLVDLPQIAVGAEPVPAGADERFVPALVDMGQFDITSTLEDHIAMLDAELSEARARQVPEAQLRPVQSAREQLSASLQRVTYAHSLLSL